MKSQISATARQIDHLVYELYGPSDEEIKTENRLIPDPVPTLIETTFPVRNN